MIPAAFEYFAPTSVREAISLLQQHGDDAKVLAGGHSLLPLMKFRLAQPKVVVDIGRIPGLDGITVAGDKVVIGALATHDAVERSPILKEKCPLLPETAAVIGDMQVRNRGTIGGSLAHADPAADYPGAILALDAEIVATGPAGTRTIPARDFFVEMLTTALGPAELITEVRVPVLPPGTGTGQRGRRGRRGRGGEGCQGPVRARGDRHQRGGREGVPGDGRGAGPPGEGSRRADGRGRRVPRRRRGGRAERPVRVRGVPEAPRLGVHEARRARRCVPGRLAGSGRAILRTREGCESLADSARLESV